MIRLIYAIVIGLVGASVVHLAIVFLLPRYSQNSAWNAIVAATTINQPVEMNGEGDDPRLARLVSRFDPYFRQVVCRYDISEGGMRIHADVQAPLWTAAIYDSLALSYASGNDRLTAGQLLDFAIVDDRQLRFVRQNTPSVLTDSVIVPARDTQGFVIVRVFVPDRSWTQLAESFVQAISCDTLTF
ncbi:MULTISPECIES: hypothetical protein [unclassified Roseitalea]|uniref:DUF1254 domain-containing protein n=1 Tax=unclassified Roseitalea TaxID=2639107 RepID=UPI00273E149F|nr:MULTISPECIES: hypothetical protein [unclassified Roseitalea]